MANCSRCQVPERECICGGAQIEALTQELAAVRAELEKMREERNESDSRLRSVLRSDPLKAGVDAERARMAAEKERDELVHAVNVVMILLSEIRDAHESPDSDGCVWYPPEELRATLPVKAQSLLREVEALRGVEKAAREAVGHEFGHRHGGRCDRCDAIDAALAALDAVEAGRK